MLASDIISNIIGMPLRVVSAEYSSNFEQYALWVSSWHLNCLVGAEGPNQGIVSVLAPPRGSEPRSSLVPRRGFGDHNQETRLCLNPLPVHEDDSGEY